jgi:nickel-dependent lactate racemase
VIYISDAPDQIVKDLHMIPAHSLNEAMKMAEEIIGSKEAKVTAIPDGVSVMVIE